MRWILLAAVSGYIGQSMPPESPISPTHSHVTVEDYDCEVTSPYTITCQNVGRYCRQRVADNNAWSASREFGCALRPGWPQKHTCPTDAETAQHEVPTQCWPLQLGP